MSTENQNTNQSEKTLLHFEDNGENIKVQLNGKGGDLINLLANAIDSNPNVRMIVELSLQAVRKANGEGDSGNPLMAMMAALAARADEGEE